MRANRVALLLLVAPTAFAHHSAAMFDATKTITLEGSIERYEWANPQVYIHLASSSGTWVVEAGSPSMMERVGWTADSFAVGDVVSIDVNPTRNAERLMARPLHCCAFVNVAENRCTAASQSAITEAISSRFVTRPVSRILSRLEVSWRPWFRAS